MQQVLSMPHGVAMPSHRRDHPRCRSRNGQCQCQISVQTTAIVVCRILVENPGKFGFCIKSWKTRLDARLLPFVDFSTDALYLLRIGNQPYGQSMRDIGCLCRMTCFTLPAPLVRCGWMHPIGWLAHHVDIDDDPASMNLGDTDGRLLSPMGPKRHVLLMPSPSDGHDKLGQRTPSKICFVKKERPSPSSPGSGG